MVVQDWLDTQNRIRWIEPEGAFYGFLHVDGLKNSLDFALRLVREARVGTAPGSAFSYAGDTQADSYLRICFAQDAQRVAAGLERLGKAVAGL
jgi:aspartate/methionine/tyrosine aminotransferase